MFPFMMRTLNISLNNFPVYHTALLAVRSSLVLVL